MLVPQAVHDGLVAATNAVRGATTTLADQVSPIGSFTDPEYAQVGLTEAKARESHDVVVTTIRFDETTRTIIDGRTTGFCKLIVDRADVHHPGLPCRGRTGRRDCSGGGHSHGRADAGGRPGPGSAVVSDLCRQFSGARHTVPPNSSTWRSAARCTRRRTEETYQQCRMRSPEP